MARQVRDGTLETRQNRLKLPISTAPRYVKIGKGVALGYRRNATNGTWSARISDGAGGNTRKMIGTADDFGEADGKAVLDYWQASEAARRLGSGDTASPIVTLGDALNSYAADLEQKKGDPLNVTRIRRHITPALLKRPVALLGAAELKKWRDSLPISPASIDRTCRGLKAALNRCADLDKTIDRHAWQIGLSLIDQGEAEADRNVILSDAVVDQIITAARLESFETGLFVEVAAQTGARPSQIRRLEIQNLISGAEPRLMMPSSRKGKRKKLLPHYSVPISAGLADRLRVAAQDRAVTEPLLLRPSGTAWDHGDQKKPFRRIAVRAGQDPSKVTIYTLRHSSIVRQLLAKVPVRIVAVAHDTSVAMIERTYSRHLSDHTDTILREVMRPDPAQADVVPIKSKANA